MAEQSHCWCNETVLTPSDELYFDCHSCGTLVRRAMPTVDITRVRDEDKDLYGLNYWCSRQEELGLPSLQNRSISDLTDRCMHWLDVLLKYRLPPARVLELGASHGGFVALLNQAGYDATGLEISPSVAAFARDAYGVTMLEGPIEDQGLAAATFDIVIVLDVLEHLPDPLGTINRCSELLSEEGILLIQTPCRPPDQALSRLQSRDHPFAQMLLPEHLFLFSRTALSELLNRVGFTEQAFEPAIFAADMFVLASRHSLARTTNDTIEENLKQSPGGRLILSRLDLANQRNHLEELFVQADADRIGRQTQIDSLQEDLAQQTTDWQTKVSLLEKEHELAVMHNNGLETDVKRLQQEALETSATAELDHQTIDGLRSEIDQLKRVQSDLESTAETLSENLVTAEQAAVRQQSQIAELHDQVAEARTAAEEARNDLSGTQSDLAEFEATLAQERQTLEAYAAAVVDHQESSAWLAEQVQSLESLIGNFRRSRVYRSMVSGGHWRRFDRLIDRAMTDRCPPKITPRAANPDGVETWIVPGPGATPIRNHRRTIAVDLTALLPGAENGGAKLVATELVRTLAGLTPEWDFLLLTSDACHTELGALDSHNIRRRCCNAVHELQLSETLTEEPLDLLFSPMTAPPFHDPRLPVVSVVHDLQLYTYPDFFEDQERAARDRAFKRAVTWSDRVVTVSDYVRTTVLKHSNLAPESVVTIHNGLADRLIDPAQDEVQQTLTRYGLQSDGYLLYPANFWPHKNHRMLLTAFSLFHHHHPDATLQLVLTGSDRPDPEPIREAAQRMCLNGKVIIPGYVSDDDLASLLTGCRALVFPSLYEGFGIPVTEAMARARPVICSRVTSLPEVAGEAALLVDPRQPDELATAIEKVWSDDNLAQDLGSRGLDRIKILGGRERMARAYLDVFESVLAGPRLFKDALAGVFADHWCGAGFVVSFSEAAHELRLELGNQREDAVTLRTTVGHVTRHLVLKPQQSIVLTCRLPEQSGYLEFEVSSTFCPAERGPSPDSRLLGIRLIGCHLLGSHDTDLLAELGSV